MKVLLLLLLLLFWFGFFLLGLSELAILDVVFPSIPLSLFISPLTCILLPPTILDGAIVFSFVWLAVWVSFFHTNKTGFLFSF